MLTARTSSPASSLAADPARERKANKGKGADTFQALILAGVTTTTTHHGDLGCEGKSTWQHQPPLYSRCGLRRCRGRGSQLISLSVHLVMGSPNARAGVKMAKKKPLEQHRATQSLITTSGIAVGLALVVPILVGWSGLANCAI